MRYLLAVLGGFLLSPVGASAQAVDTARVGPLLIHARSMIDFRGGRDRLGAPDVMGDLAVLATIENRGPTSIETVLQPCGVRVRAYSDSTRPHETQISQFAEGRSQCMADATDIRLNSGDRRDFPERMQGWTVAGDRRPLGPWHVLVDVHLGDTIVTVRAGKVSFDTGLSKIRYRVTTRIDGVAPAHVRTQIMIQNRGDSVARLEFGDCPIMLRGFQSVKKTGKPVWITERTGPPFMKTTGFACTLRLNTTYVQPRDSFRLTASIPTYEILGDTLPEGRYHVSAELRLNWRTIDLDAGSIIISRKQQSLPASRTIDDIRYSASLKRIKSDGITPDWLEFSVTVKNLGKTIRQLRTYGSSRCAVIVGYATPERRDSHYMRSAREDRNGIVRTCPVIIPDLILNPGQALTFSGQMLAPDVRSYYLLFLGIMDRQYYRGEPLDISLAADETR